MVDGFFLNIRDLPAVKVPVVFGETVSSPDFILDTGFSGDIKVDTQTANDLGIDLNDAAITYIGNATGQRVPARLAHGFAELEGKKKPMNIIVADGPHLVGISFLSAFGYTAVVDCKNWECYLESSR